MGDMRIMLVDDNGDLRRGMRDYLARQEGMKVVAECPSGAEALEALGKVRVDVMVLDLIMPQMDGFALMEEVRRQQLPNPPQIIVVSALGRDDFIMRAVQLGARFYMVKPFDMASLAARIRESCGQGVVPLGTALNASARSLSIDEKLASLFLTIGIPAHIKGYQFLRTAVKMVVDNPDMINRITKELYPSIGKCYNTSASKVERAIRHAIEVAWSRGRIDTLNKAFGCRVATKEDKPTNGEFIAMLAEVQDEAEFCIRQVRGDEFACRRVMTDKIVDGYAEVVCDAGQNGNVRLGIAVLILVDGLLADLNEISQSALAQTLSGTECLQIREHSKEQPPVILRRVVWSFIIIS